jgi:hypothetical protein
MISISITISMNCMNSALDFVTTISRYPKIVVLVSLSLRTNKFR